MTIPFAKPAVHPIFLHNSAVPRYLIYHPGEDGLQIELPQGLNERPVEEVRTLGRAFRSIVRTQSPFVCQIKPELVLAKRNVETRKLEQIVRPSNRLSLGVDATSLFQRDNDHSSDSRLGVALNRVRSVNLFSVGIRHNVQASASYFDHV